MPFNQLYVPTFMQFGIILQNFNMILMLITIEFPYVNCKLNVILVTMQIITENYGYLCLPSQLILL